MSKYTTEVRFICESLSGLGESVGYGSVEDVISASRSKVFDFDYPIYDEEYRSVLETKILKHFYTREIGAETVGLWKLWLNTRLNEIMPYYNKMYESTLLEYNPILDVDITTTRNGNNGGTKNDNGSNSGTNELANTGTTTDSGTNTNVRSDTGSSEHWNYYSDTPQGGINGMILSNNNYLTNATNDTDSHNNGITDNGSATNTRTDNTKATTTYSGTNSNTSTYNNTEEYIEHVIGKRGGLTYSKMIEEFRSAIINVDVKIIHELDDLFLNLW